MKVLYIVAFRHSQNMAWVFERKGCVSFCYLIMAPFTTDVSENALTGAGSPLYSCGRSMRSGEGEPNAC